VSLNYKNTRMKAKKINIVLKMTIHVINMFKIDAGVVWIT